LYHKPGKIYIILDALSHLLLFIKDESDPTTLDTNPLDILFGHAFHGDQQPDLVVIRIAISNDFK
jgi:hypothetical protein